MTDIYYQAIFYVQSVLFSGEMIRIIMVMFPFVLLLELPFYITLLSAVLRKWLWIYFVKRPDIPYNPKVTIIVCAYSEQEEIYLTLASLYEQIYAGYIEVIIVIDDALKNVSTTGYVNHFVNALSPKPNRQFIVIERKTRGGVSSSRNIALKKAKGEIILVLDADTSIENGCVAAAVKYFHNPNVVGLSGALRVKNNKENLLCRIQDVEYKLGIELARFGLSQLGILNNISGAFGFFRTSMLRKVGGWLSGTAEDLDLLMRIYAYTQRYPALRTEYAHDAIGYTNVPTTILSYIKQRLRWEGDLYYIYIRRHWRAFSGKLLGRWKAFFLIWYGLYYQIALPFVVLCYEIYIIANYNIGIVLGINIIVFLYYFTLISFLFIFYVLMLSQAVKKNIADIPILFLMPVFQLVYKLLTVAFLLNEIILKGHKKTNMAPWWVVDKTK